MSYRMFLRLTLVLVLLAVPRFASAADVALELSTALELALRNNADLQAKRQSLGIAQGRAQQAELLFQNNPRFSAEVESLASGRSDTSIELNLLQEFEIAGQGGHRSEAAKKNLAQSQMRIEDAERLLRLEVTRSFYHLLALQQRVRDLEEVLAAQENLLQTGKKRFGREDITILELNTLRLDRDQVRSELANQRRERVAVENELRRLTGLPESDSLVASGDLVEISTKTFGITTDRQTLQACSLASRVDLKAAKLAVEVREAELRLAQARRIPNISLGPRYKRDINQNIIGGEIEIPLPFFNRNQEEIAVALTNRNISKTELKSHTLLIKQQLDATYTKLALARDKLESYGTEYLGDLEKMLALTRKAYESGEMSIFEFSVTRDRFTQARARSLDAALNYVQTLAELEAQAPGCLR